MTLVDSFRMVRLLESEKRQSGGRAALGFGLVDLDRGPQIVTALLQLRFTATRMLREPRHRREPLRLQPKLCMELQQQVSLIELAADHPTHSQRRSLQLNAGHRDQNDEDEP